MICSEVKTLEISTIKQQIKTKSPRSFYIFTGPEIKVMDIYINKIADCKKLPVKRIETISDIYGKLRNNSFVDQSFCYVLRDDKELLTTEKLWNDLYKINIQKNNIIILILTSIDKRNKFYKYFKDVITEFAPLSEAILIRYIKKEINLSEPNCKKLIELCESDYSRILLEIDKVKHFQDSTIDSEDFKEEQNQVFKKLLKQGVIYQPPKDALFEYVDAVLRHHVNRAFDLLEQCYAVGETTIVLLSVLYNNTKQVLQVQSCESKEIGKSTGLTGWQIKCAKEKIGHYSTGDLVYMLKLIRYVEKGIKTGQIEESIALPYIMTEIF